MSSKKIVIVAFLLSLVSIGFYFFISKDHRNIEKEDAVFTLSARQLIDDFDKNYENAILKYSNQTITVFGVASQKSKRSLVFEDKIYCSFNNPIASINPQSLITVKGRCVGYDDLLHEIRLNQCNLVSDE